MLNFLINEHHLTYVIYGNNKWYLEELYLRCKLTDIHYPYDLHQIFWSFNWLNGFEFLWFDIFLSKLWCKINIYFWIATFTSFFFFFSFTFVSIYFDRNIAQNLPSTTRNTVLVEKTYTNLSCDFIPPIDYPNELLYMISSIYF